MKYILPMMMLAAMPLAADAQNKSGLVMSNLDKTAKPADDFYQFATGGWQKSHQLPTADMAVSTNSQKTTTNVSTQSLQNSRRRPTRREPSRENSLISTRWLSMPTAATRKASPQ